MISVIFAAAVLLADVTPAAGEAATAQAPAAAAPAAKEKDKDALVCHTEATPGSRLPKKTCFRAGDAAQRRLEDRAAVERAQAMTSAPRGN
ncbi:MAG: hypothetical protein JWQ29_1956 [Phenylobacterium sp.]|nr:hypothetical protein [Phenylobacterium sp.]